MNNLYITESSLGCGEVSVEGRAKDGSLIFGFRTMQCAFKSWRDKARAYTPPSYVPVFQASKPAELRL